MSRCALPSCRCVKLCVLGLSVTGLSIPNLRAVKVLKVVDREVIRIIGISCYLITLELLSPIPGSTNI